MPREPGLPAALNASVEATRAGPSTFDVKRLSVPAVVRWTCPKCKTEHAEDLSSAYLSFPPANAPFKHVLYCSADLGEEDCDQECEVELYLSLTLRKAGP